MPSDPRFDWILFDADDTLFHFDAFAGLSRLFAGLGVSFTERDYDTYQRRNHALWVDYQNGDIRAADVQHRRFDAWSQRLDRTTGELNSGFLAAMADICALYPGVAEMLAALAGRARLGIITNGFTELQTLRLARTGVAGSFEVLVISEEVGHAKPAPQIFAHALALMGSPAPARVLMVGDNPNTDIQGGIAAGMQTCWLNVTRRPRPLGISPTYEVHSHAALRDLLLPGPGAWVSALRPVPGPAGRGSDTPA